MKLPNWLKIAWWVVLVGLFAYLFHQRYDVIMSGTATAIDIIIFLILIALIVVPLFQEVNLFGVSLKKEIDSLKGEIVNLKNEIHSEQNVYVYPPPSPDSELSSLEERVRPILEQILRDQDIQRPVLTPEEVRISNDTQFLFSVRYAIESELRRIFNVSWESLAKEGYLSIAQSARELYNWEKINSEMYEAIRELNSICSASIHGKTVSEKALNFVRNIAPELLASLRSIEPIDWGKNPNYRRKR